MITSQPKATLPQPGRIIPIEALPASWTEIDNKKVGKAFERASDFWGILLTPAWMSRWKLGSMVSKWVITYKWGILGLYAT